VLVLGKHPGANLLNDVSIKLGLRWPWSLSDVQFRV
jgi:hypothetical protein